MSKTMAIVPQIMAKVVKNTLVLFVFKSLKKSLNNIHNGITIILYLHKKNSDLVKTISVEYFIPIIGKDSTDKIKN